ncbi:MAG: sulfotransferase family 2 domain-containing protein [Prochlorococcaceae cyanobacterium]
MLLIPDRQALFLHIPKTGGQTIESLLGCPHRHSHHATQGLPHNWQQWFRFTFVRHPVDRFVSACNYYVDMAVRHERVYRQHSDPSPMVAFRLWLIDRRPLLPAVVERLAEDRRYRAISGFVPQIKRLKAIQPQFVGRFERFGQDVNTLLSVLRYERRLDTDLPHVNRSLKHYRRESLDNSSLRTLAHLYRADFRRLGYKPGRIP